MPDLATEIKGDLLKKLEKIRALVEYKIKENATLVDHSLRELKELGYPYSSKNPQHIHVPDWLVHTQTGALADSISVIVNEETLDIEVHIDEVIAPHAKFIIYGTSSMVPRDFISGTFEELEDEIQMILGGK